MTTIIFIHGWMTDKTLWREIIANLDLSVRVINFELAGFGESVDYLNNHKIQDIEPRQQSKALHLLLKQLLLPPSTPQKEETGQTRKKEKLILVGHGTGGAIIKEFLQSSDKDENFDCTGVILSSCSFGDFGCPKTWWDTFIQVATFPIIGDFLGLAPNIITLFLINWLLYFTSTDTKTYNALQRMVLENQLMQDYGIAAALIKQLRSFVWYGNDRLPFQFMQEIEGTLRIISGSNDWMFPIAHAEAFIHRLREQLHLQTEKKVRDLKLLRVEGAGHFLPLSHSKAIVETVTDIASSGEKQDRKRAISASYEVIM